jgi:protein-disulfide isomerase
MLKHLIRMSLGLMCFAFASAVFSQEIKPGASPAWETGNATAAVSIEIFNDYQCPACATFNERLKKIQTKHKDNVRIIFRNYPLTRTHENALLAAQTAEASGMQGKFFEMIDQLYATQRDWAESDHAKDLFISYAELLKLDLYKFAADLDRDAVRERIQLDVDRAKSLAIRGTPTVLFNGKLLFEKVDDIERLVDQAINPKSQN